MDKISTLLNDLGSDKCRQKHCYHYIYNDLFSKYDRNAELDILESGVEFGPSVFAWKEYFPNAHVVGVDIEDKRQPQLIRSDMEFVLGDIKNYKPDRLFDIIIEDGDHSNHDALWAGMNLSHLLKIGGTLIIEDIQEGFMVPFLLWGKLYGNFAVSAIDLRRYTDTHDNFLIKIEKWNPNNI